MSKKSVKFVVFLVCLLVVALLVLMFIQSNHISSSSVVSKGKYSAGTPSITLDSNDIPHLTWFSQLSNKNHSDPEESDVFYVKQEGKNWVTASGEIFDDKNGDVSKSKNRTSWGSSVALDLENNPHVVWYDYRTSTSDDDYYGYKDNINYVKWSEGNWLTARGKVYKHSSEPATITYNWSRDASIAIDSKGFVHLVWHSDKNYNNQVMYVKRDGENWVTIDGEIFDSETRNANVSRKEISMAHPQLILDSNDYPCLLWGDGRNDEYLIFIRWNGKNWVSANGEIYDPWGTNNASLFTGENRSVWDIDLTLDSNDNPHIAWTAWLDYLVDGYLSDSELFYLTWNGENWMMIDGSIYQNDSEIPNIGFDIQTYHSLSIAVDSTFQPHLAWTVDNKNVYYSKWGGEEWVTVSGEKLSQNAKNCNISRNIFRSINPELVLDSNDNPHIIWCNASLFDTDSKIMYIKWNGTNWVCADGSVY